MSRSSRASGRYGTSTPGVPVPLAGYTRGALTPVTPGLISLRDAARIDLDAQQRQAGAALGLNDQAEFYPADLGAIFSATRTTGQILDNVTNVLNFTAELQVLRGYLRRDRWRIVGASCVANGTQGGPWQATNWRADGQDLGQSLAFRGSAYVIPIQSLLPPSWAGNLLVSMTNRNGSANTAYLTVFLAPAPVGC